ncbi:MAG: FAD-dependent oxidoreductase [Bacillota bacterium]
MSTVLVLGGGTGGVVAANVLSKTLDKKKHMIKLVDRKDSHVFLSSYPMLMINKRKPQAITRKLERLGKKGIEVIQAEVEKINLERSSVQTGNGLIDYDYLIISLGAEHHLETVPGFAEGAYNVYNFDDLIRLSGRLKAFNKGKIVFFISSLPFVCPPAPYEMIFLLDAYLRQRGIRDNIELTLVTPEPTPEPLGGPRVGESVRNMMKQRGIGLFTEAKVLSLDNTAKSLLLDQGINLEADLFLGIPSHWGPTVLRETGLVEPGGWIKTDPHTLQTDWEKVFGVGDATALRLPVMGTLAPKAGIFAHYQAEVVARNIALLIQGKKPKHRYTAKGL